MQLVQTCGYRSHKVATPLHNRWTIVEALILITTEFEQ
jgi:hypothetical protein